MKNTHKHPTFCTLSRISTATLLTLLTLSFHAHADETSADLLLSRLKLDVDGLREINKIADTSDKTAALLAYYRKRTDVKRPVSYGNSLSSKDRKIADNAIRHILIGQKSYASQFRGDDIDWSTNPVPDKEWIWQLHRMYFWNSMANAYFHTCDEKYAREWCSQLQDWIRKNPRDNKHQFAWRSIEAGIRGHSWTALFQCFHNSPSFTPDVLVDFLNSCYDHASFLMTKYSSKSNWGLMEAEGMAFIALTFPEFKDSQKWLKESVSRLNREISNQVYQDGHQRELAFGYHCGCIEWFMRTLELAEANGKKELFPPEYLSTIEKMCAVVMQVSFPDGSTPQFGDSWSGGPGSTYANLKSWSGLFNRSDMLYASTEGKEGLKPEQTAFALKESGFYSLRSGWNRNDICLIMKCGPSGGFHCQPDNGTFELYAGGNHLMPDSGCYIYSGDPDNRNWFRSTRNHQTLTLDEKNSAFAPKLLLWQPGENDDIVSVENQSYKNLTHRRTICFIDKQYFFIVDDAYGSATGNVDLNFQLAPGPAIIDTTDLAAHTGFKDGWNVSIKALSNENVTMSEVEGRVSFRYTKKEPRPAFRYRIKKTDAHPVRFITLLTPYREKQPVVNITPVEEISKQKTIMELQITSQDHPRTISYSLPAITIP